MNQPNSSKWRGKATKAEAAIKSRRSIRAFLPDPVAPELLEQVLTTAARAPSGSNIQPWKVYVLQGESRDQLCAEILQAHEDGEEHHPEYDYYPTDWREPYLARRRATGWGLYGLLGIERGDKARMKAQLGRNYLFFDAPVGLIFTIDRDLNVGSWMDYGMFLQSIMIAARGVGLDTCPQQAFALYHSILQQRLGIPEAEMVVCGMSLGYADMTAPENALVTDREPLEGFTTFVGALRE